MKRISAGYRPPVLVGPRVGARRRASKPFRELSMLSYRHSE
jgi:hypothetical protein